MLWTEGPVELGVGHRFQMELFGLGFEHRGPVYPRGFAERVSYVAEIQVR